MTKNDAVRLVAVMTATWPQAKVSAETVAAYATFIADLDYEAAHAAVEKLASTSAKFPAVSDIKQTAAEIRLGLPSPFIAWEQFVNRDKDQHPLVRRVAKSLGGWSAYSMSDVPSIFRAQFLKMYAEARGEAVAGEATGQPMLPAPPPRLTIEERSLDSEPLTDEQRREFIRNMNTMLGR